ADGGGWNTEVLLVNSSDATATGALQFVSPAGQSLSVNLDGQTNSQFSYSIPARSSRRFRTAGSVTTTSTGWIEIVPSGNTRTPLALGILSARAGNVTFSETAINAVPAANAFRVFAETSGNYAAREARSAQTGVAISNGAASAVTVNLEATNPDGTVAASTSMLIPG